MKRMMNVLGAAILISVFIFGCGKSESEASDSSSKSEAIESEKLSSYPKAPEFKLQNLNGEEVKLSDYSGKLIFVNFWATWCPPCRAEIPGFIKMYDQYKDQGLVILGISTDRDGKEVVKKFVDKNKVNYPILLYNMEVIRAYGGITGIPTTFIVNQMGEIVNKFVGFPGDEAFENEIKKWLPGKKS
jgi:cytochrome c biogenesis protein CcmG/thiol:disulfide interchange protein DsbE